MKSCYLNWLWVLCLLLPGQAECQKLDIAHEVFPGIETVIIRASRSGYWVNYSLNERGRAATETRFKNKQHLATRVYEFTRNGYLMTTTTTFDSNNPRTVQVIYNTYTFSPDSARIVQDWCHSATDTLYVVTYTGFAGSYPTSYQKVIPRGAKTLTEDITVAYANSKPVTWESRDGITNVVTRCEYSYNEKGDVATERRLMVPASKQRTYWIDGQGDFQQWKYAYDDAGRWTKKYALFQGRWSLIETRKFVKRKALKS